MLADEMDVKEEDVAEDIPEMDELRKEKRMVRHIKYSFIMHLKIRSNFRHLCFTDSLFVGHVFCLFHHHTCSKWKFYIT